MFDKIKKLFDRHEESVMALAVSIIAVFSFILVPHELFAGLFVFLVLVAYIDAYTGNRLGKLFNRPKTTIEKVSEFHRDFGTASLFTEDGCVNWSVAQLRIRLMQEELDEVKEELRAPIIHRGKLVKELCDLQFVLDETFLAAGYSPDHKEVAFDVVHNNNMSKKPRDGKVLRDEAGKVLKPKNYVPVDTDRILD